MNILITGANGQLGTALREQLQGVNEHQCYFLDRKQLPLSETFLIQDILGMYEPDLIIHTAAYTAVDLAESEPELADLVNHVASEEIAQYCRVNGVKLLAISTDYVFDGLSAVALTESAPAAPLNVYGLTKWKGELAIHKWCPDAIIIRTSWVYAPGGQNFVNTMLRLMEVRDVISVIDDQVGSPTNVDDLAQAILQIIHADTWIGGIYHYSNEGQISWYDFAVAIRDIRQLNCEVKAISSAEYPTVAKRPKFSLLDKSKIKTTFGVNVPFWKDSLARMLFNGNKN